MPSRSRGGRVRAVLRTATFAVLVAVIGYVAVQVVPRVVTSFRFAQAMQNEVLYGPVSEPPSVIHRRLVAEAERLGLNIRPEAIVVQKEGARLSISANYVTRVDLAGGFEFDWPVAQRYEGVRRGPAPGR